jgi:phosphoribosylanthranilate isomerase
MPVPAKAVDTGLPDVGSGPLLKVCGITESAELEVLGANKVDLTGLWYGVAGGPADLPLTEWRRLAAGAIAAGVAPVLVTFSKEIEMLREALEGSRVRWVQLHGYQTPGFVRAVKRVDPDVLVLKVLHVRGQDCVESPLIASYEKAGVDVFLFDAVAQDGRVGSTGERLDAEFAASLADQISRPFLLAGGISAGNREQYRALAGHPRFLGIDVDTNARGTDGKIAAQNVAAISQAWKSPAET